VSGAGQIPLSTWTHIAAVRTGTSVNFYINGVLDTTLTGVMDANPFRNGTTTLRLGGQGRGARGRFLSGRLDEARIYARALTQVEIQQYMAVGAPRRPGAPKNLQIIR
jgi:Concanavalin A-like lectin/glucanases superfamily